MSLFRNRGYQAHFIRKQQALKVFANAATRLGEVIQGIDDELKRSASEIERLKGQIHAKESGMDMLRDEGAHAATTLEKINSILN